VRVASRQPQRPSLLREHKQTIAQIDPTKDRDMAELNAKDVMKLRDKTGLPMMACKAALIESAGDFDKAEDILRKQMKGKMDSKTDKVAGEGRIAIAVGASSATIIELKANTDFTAKNDAFIGLANTIAQGGLKLAPGSFASNAAFAGAIDDIRAKTGETITLGRAEHVAGGPNIKFGAYVHHDGKTGALVKVEGEMSDEGLKQICMHIVAAQPRPQGVSAADVPAAVVERERKFRIEQAMETGKPKEIAEKMVEGGMRKFFEEIALLEQPYIMDPTKKVKDITGSAKVHAFWRWQVGE
jgi:elongation factor Ts